MILSLRATTTRGNRIKLNMTDVQKILVGKIVAAQGLRGEVRVQTYTESPADLANLKIDDLDLKFIRAAGRDVAICKIANINDRNAAESLRGTELFINRESLPQLPDGQFYHTDLIGMLVGENRVVDIQNFGAGDILELDNGEMISFANAKVDLERREITIK